MARTKIVVQEFNQLARLYDAKKDNTAELTIVRNHDDGTLGVIIEDRDAGTQSPSLDVDVKQLLAAVHLLAASEFVVEP